MSFVQVMSHSGGGMGTDRTPFYGIKLPAEVKKLIQLSKSTEHAILKAVLKMVVEYMETGTGDTEKLTSLETTKVTQENLRTIFSGMHAILSTALKQPGLKIEIFKDDLKQVKMPPELIADLGSVLSSSKRAKLDRSILEQRVRLPQVEALNWRVDVTISNSSLQRVLEPSILMEMKLSDGSIKAFEVPVSKFHEMRYSVAYVLKEMEDLEKRNILKLSD